MYFRHKHIIIGFSTLVAGGILTAAIILFGYGAKSQASDDQEVPIIFEPIEVGIPSAEVNEVPIPSSSTSTPTVVSESVLLDIDGDGLDDEIEHQFGTDFLNPDTDGDGYKDGEEVYNGYSPLIPKPDRSLVTRTVEVNLDRQELYYMMDGKKVRTVQVSTGLPDKRTPTGRFKVRAKYPVARYIGPDYDLPGVKWNLEFKPNYFIHGTYWHNFFGQQAASHGCVNLSESDAEKIYAFLQMGDSVVIYGKTPLGKVIK